MNLNKCNKIPLFSDIIDRDMQEAELIKTIQKLRKIKPRKDWVLLTKSQILPDYETRQRNLFFPQLVLDYKPVFATIFTVAILISVFAISQKAFPGDLLYSLKRITEIAKLNLVSETERPKVHLEFANKRLIELTKIAQTNQVKNLAPAINEFQANISEAAKNLNKLTEEPQSDSGLVKEVVFQTKKLEENKKKVEALGVVVGETEELNNALALLVAREIESLDSQILSESQQELLMEAKVAFEAGDYSGALEKILFLSNYNAD